ncbi:hypothetical protein GOV10_00225 [Candidatus Woesearchaeota archaeon]|nr:hypothetical protein [Candidatus Woesearchaeota archaeon]
MSIQSFLGRILGKKKRYSYDFTDADRENSAEIRRLKGELRQSKKMLCLKQEIGELRNLAFDLRSEDDFEDVEEQPDFLNGMLEKLISGALTPQQPTEAQTSQLIDMNDDELKQVIATIPKRQLTIAKKLDDDTLIKVASSHFPALNETSVKRAIALLRL